MYQTYMRYIQIENMLIFRGEKSLFGSFFVLNLVELQL